MKTLGTHHLLRLILTIAGLSTATSAIAATRIDLQREDILAAKRRNAEIAAAGTATMTHQRHAQALELDNESRLVLIARESMRGARNYRYRQLFRGLPVFGEQIIVNEDDAGSLRTLFGKKVVGLERELAKTTIKLQSKEALARAKYAALGLDVGFMRTRNEEIDLSIYVDDDRRAYRAYIVNFFADTDRGGSPRRPTVIIDADSGRILKQWDNLQHAQIGTGPGGNYKTGQYEYGLQYGYLDVEQPTAAVCLMQNPQVKTISMNNSTSDADEYFSYNCPRNTFQFVNGAFSPINDAHYFGNAVYAMYMNWLYIPPLNSQLLMRVHYGSDYPNAFWDGSSMSFGDGNSNYYPFVSLDVAAHEVSHGFTEQNSGLLYHGESGGINEAFSDIAGESAEYYLRGNADWLVGADITKQVAAIRYMYDPPLDGQSIDHVSDYSPGMDVHYSSGIYNKAFYRLANNTAFWNPKKAFEVFAHANRWYWTPSTDFDNGACGVQYAANDYGYSAQDVANAFATVGVYCNSSGGPPVISAFGCDVEIGHDHCRVTYSSPSSPATVVWSGLYGSPLGDHYYSPCGGIEGSVFIHATVFNAYGSVNIGSWFYCHGGGIVGN
jgi:vibriolysin